MNNLDGSTAKTARFWPTPEDLATRERISLSSEGAEVVVNPIGGYVESFTFTDENATEQNFLFPKQEIQGSKRGGMHICLPNFGPDISGDLAQHGFGRDLPWTVRNILNTDTTRLELNPPETGPYHNLGAEMIMSLGTDESSIWFKTTLLLQNKGDDLLRVAPAFHPYFALPAGMPAELVPVNEKRYNTDQLRSAVTQDLTQETTLRTPDYTLQLQSDGFNKTTIWSDGKGDYLCVEPSVNGASFLHEKGDSEEYLQPGENRIYSVTMSFSPPSADL